MARRDKLNQTTAQENQQETGSQVTTEETGTANEQASDVTLTEVTTSNDEQTEVTNDTTSTEEQTSNTDSTEETGTTEEQISSDVQDPPEETKTTPEPVKEVVVDPAYVSFFNQYLGLLMAGNIDGSIKALNNCVKAMMKAGTGEAFDTVFELFKENERTITLKNKLQGIAALSKQDRAIVEVVTTIYHIILTDTKKSLDLEKARPVIKNNDFINWCAKKIG